MRHIKWLCHTSACICCLFKKLKPFSHKLNSKNNGPVLLFKNIFRHRNCFPSSFVTDDKDGRGLKLGKRWARVFKF